jgi:hypothetical protein
LRTQRKRPLFPAFFRRLRVHSAEIAGKSPEPQQKYTPNSDILTV